MSSNERSRKNIEQEQKLQEREFVETLPFPQQHFNQLFDHLGSELNHEKCRHDFRLTSAFLRQLEINFEKHIDFFAHHGAGCDCEVLLNLADLFPEYDASPNEGLVVTRKKVRIQQLTFHGIRLTQVPNPWRLFEVDSGFEFQLGKKDHIRAFFSETLDFGNWNDEGYWKMQGESLTGFTAQLDQEVIYETVGDFDLVVFKVKSWTPVLVAARLASSHTWGLLFRTELSRTQNDLREFKKLLSCFEILDFSK